MTQDYKIAQREAEVAKKTKFARLRWDSDKNGTYDAGKNKAKREKRDLI